MHFFNLICAEFKLFFKSVLTIILEISVKKTHKISVFLFTFLLPHCIHAPLYFPGAAQNKTGDVCNPCVTHTSSDCVTCRQESRNVYKEGQQVTLASHNGK